MRANSVCFSLRLPCGLSASSFDRISSELSGVRSSWLMLARNSDLYFEVSASCSAFSSTARRAISISRFFASTCFFSFSSSCAFSCSSSLVACSSSCLVVSSVWRACSSWVSSCDCLSRPSVRIVAAIVLSTMPTDSISWSRKLWWVSLNSLNEASSITALTSSSNRAGRMLTLAGAAWPRPEPMRMKSPGTSFSRIGALVRGGLADQPFAQLELALQLVAALGAIARDEFEHWSPRPRAW